MKKLHYILFVILLFLIVITPHTPDIIFIFKYPGVFPGAVDIDFKKENIIADSVANIKRYYSERLQLPDTMDPEARVTVSTWGPGYDEAMKQIKYQIIGTDQYKICASFITDMNHPDGLGYGVYGQQTFHPQGDYCFNFKMSDADFDRALDKRTIDTFKRIQNSDKENFIYNIVTSTPEAYENINAAIQKAKQYVAGSKGIATENVELFSVEEILSIKTKTPIIENAKPLMTDVIAERTGKVAISSSLPHTIVLESIGPNQSKIRIPYSAPIPSFVAFDYTFTGDSIGGSIFTVVDYGAKVYAFEGKNHKKESTKSIILQVAPTSKDPDRGVVFILQEFTGQNTKLEISNIQEVSSGSAIISNAESLGYRVEFYLNNDRIDFLKRHISFYINGSDFMQFNNK